MKKLTLFVCLSMLSGCLTISMGGVVVQNNGTGAPNTVSTAPAPAPEPAYTEPYFPVYDDTYTDECTGKMEGSVLCQP